MKHRFKIVTLFLMVLALLLVPVAFAAPDNDCSRRSLEPYFFSPDNYLDPTVHEVALCRAQSLSLSLFDEGYKVKSFNSRVLKMSHYNSDLTSKKDEIVSFALGEPVYLREEGTSGWALVATYQGVENHKAVLSLRYVVAS